MAEFCNQCSIRVFGEDFGDFYGLCKQGEVVAVLCEGCGPTFVDHLGNCTVDCCNKTTPKENQ